MFSLEQGKKLIKAAREAVASKFEGKDFKLENFKEPAGIFVTIHSYPDNELKGCIGFPEPIFPLNEALVRAAKAAAFSDPRFMPVQKEDLEKIIFEVSVLTKPELIKAEKPEDYKKEIKIGRDGLVAEQGHFKGLLLPQVASQHDMNQEMFLSCTCEKAGLPSEAWKDIKTVKVYKFQAQIFKETKPNGEVIETKSF